MEFHLRRFHPKGFHPNIAPVDVIKKKMHLEEHILEIFILM